MEIKIIDPIILFFIWAKQDDASDPMDDPLISFAARIQPLNVASILGVGLIQTVDMVI